MTELSKQEKTEVIGRIWDSVLNFLPYVKIEEPGRLAVKYEVWEHIKDFFWHLENYNLIDLIKSKQIGISWALAAYALWKIYTLEGWSVLEFSKRDVEAQQLLDKSRVVYNNLPKWMKIFTLEPNNASQFGFKENRSVITAYPTTETAGIGRTAGTVIHDESDFHEFYEVNLSHTRATVADSPDRQLISVSTVDITKQDSYFQRHWKAGEGSGYPEAGRNGFKALFYGVFSRPDRDEEWYQQLVKENQETPWVVHKNYPRTIEEALSPIAAVSCFNENVLRDLWDNAAEGETREGFIHILCPPMVGVQYAAGIDVGEGVGKHYSVLTIVGKRGLSAEVVAVIYSNTIGTDSFAFECDKLCREYRNPLLIVDNIGVGRAVIDKLVELGYPKLYKMNETKYGWAFTRPNERELLVKLVERVNNRSLITRFKPQIKEMMEYQWVKDFPEPTGRTHGDTVSSLMLAVAKLDSIGQVVEPHMYVSGKMVW